MTREQLLCGRSWVMCHALTGMRIRQLNSFFCTLLLHSLKLAARAGKLHTSLDGKSILVPGKSILQTILNIQPLMIDRHVRITHRKGLHGNNGNDSTSGISSRSNCRQQCRTQWRIQSINLMQSDATPINCMTTDGRQILAKRCSGECPQRCSVASALFVSRAQTLRWVFL